MLAMFMLNVVFIVLDNTLGRGILADRGSRLFVGYLMKQRIPGVVWHNENDITDVFIGLLGRDSDEEV